MSLYATGFEVMRKVALHASFSKAAIDLGVSGAAASRQIKTLEERLGLVLFHRTTRSVVITEAGKRLIDTLNRGDDEYLNFLSN
jgi:DNA-binding transcriptional LysR family regulator